jgi:GxxExxY protein
MNRINTEGDEKMEMNEITEKIIGCAFTVANTLGSGFLEKVYENALTHEIQKAELSVQKQVPIHVNYDGIIVGEFVADLLVEEQVIVELKSVQALEAVHMAQCLNYLRATGKSVCLLINFGRPRIEVKRIVPNDHWKSTKP